jgi:hypothetical protein
MVSFDEKNKFAVERADMVRYRRQTRAWLQNVLKEEKRN